MRLLIVIVLLTLAAQRADSQWIIEESPTNADLRGIHNVGGGIAWASGSRGVVLRTVNDGRTWERCATPAGAEELDFPGIQAIDEKTAIVMSSGPGGQSRIYKTNNGCRSWIANGRIGALRGGALSPP